MHNQCPARSRWTRNIFKNKLMNEQTACPGFSPRSLNSHHPDFTHDDFCQTAFVARRPAACASRASKSRSPTANFLRMCYLRHFYPTLYLALGLKLLASRKKKKKIFPRSNLGSWLLVGGASLAYTAGCQREKKPASREAGSWEADSAAKRTRRALCLSIWG